MYFQEALRVLGLDGQDEDELTKDGVRRQYMRKLREHPPERDPEGFQRLREAFELVKGYVPDRRERRPEPEPEAPPPSLFIDASQAPAPPSASEYVVAKPARSEEKVREDVPHPDVTSVDDGEAEGPGSSGQYSFGGKRLLDSDEHEREHDDEDATDGHYSLRGPRSSSTDEGSDEDPASSGQYSFRADEIEDDQDQDDQDQDDEDEADRSHSEADVAFEAAGTGMALADLVEKILILLQHEEVDAALEVQATWRDDADTDDHRHTNHYVAIRWALTRELLVVASALPLRVVSIIAKGIAANDLSTVKEELETFRRRAPEKATEANVVLAKRASDLHKQLGGALYVPPPKREYFTNVPSFTVPDVRSSSGGGGGSAVWVILGVLVLFVRIIASTSSSSSRYSSSRYDIPKFDYSPPTIDYDALARLSRSGNDPYGDSYARSPYRPPEPETFSSTDDRETQLAGIDSSLDALLTYADVATPEQQAKLRLFRAARVQQSCSLMLKRFARVEELPASTLEFGADGDKHIRAIRERLDAICDKKPAKKVRKKPTPPKTSDATETSDQP